MSFAHKKTNLLPLDLFVRETLDIYQSRQKDYLTVSEFKQYLESPLGIIDTTPAAERAENVLIDRAVRTLVFQGREEFEHRFTNIYSDKKHDDVLNGSRLQMVESLCNVVQNNPYARILRKDGMAEGVVRAKYASCSCQIRMDWFNPFYGLVELKIADSLARFDWNAKVHRYYEQLAFFRAVIREATNTIVPVLMIVVGKREMKCRVFEVSNELLNLTEIFNLKNLARMEENRQPGQWEGLITKP